MRISSTCVLLLLAGCAQPSARAAQPGEELIDCALAGIKAFTKTCAVERTTVAGATTLVVHHPDGGFRRFDVSPDGGGISVADGAELARQQLAGGVLEVTLGDNRYRFAVTTTGDAPAN